MDRKSFFFVKRANIRQQATFLVDSRQQAMSCFAVCRLQSSCDAVASGSEITCDRRQRPQRKHPTRHRPYRGVHLASVIVVVVEADCPLGRRHPHWRRQRDIGRSIIVTVADHPLSQPVRYVPQCPQPGGAQLAAVCFSGQVRRGRGHGFQ